MNQEEQIARTLAILRELAKGKHLGLKDGHSIAMAGDMTVGYIHKEKEGEFISRLSELTLRELNDLLEREGIGFPIPTVR